MVSFIHNIFPSPESLTTAVVDCLRKSFQADGGGPLAVMLSGGNTPRAAYERLRRVGCKAGPGAYLLYSDERSVPPDSPDSNYGLTVPLIASLGLDPSRVMQVHTGLELDQAADRYHQELAQYLRAGGRIPLGLLGLGADGHTASLFSLEDVNRGHHRFAVPVRRAVKPDRISVTPGLLKRVERLIVLAVGSDKRDIITKLITSPDQVVAGHVFSDLPEVEIWQA